MRMFGRRRALLAARRRLPALVRHAGLHLRDLGAASLIVTSRRDLAIRDLGRGVWLIEDPSYRAGEMSGWSWHHVALSTHAYLLLDGSANPVNVCEAAKSLHIQNSLLYTSFLVNRFGINCVITTRTGSDELAFALRHAGYEGIVVMAESEPDLSAEEDEAARNDPRWHVLNADLDRETFGAATAARLDGVIDTAIGDGQHPRIFLHLNSIDQQDGVLSGLGNRLVDVAAMQTSVPATLDLDGLPQLGNTLAKLEGSSGLAVIGLFPTRCEQGTGRVLEFAAFLASPKLLASPARVVPPTSAESATYAEAMEVWCRDQSISITFRVEVPGMGPRKTMHVVLKARGGSASRRYPVRRGEFGQLHVDIPIANLDPGARPTDAIWDVFVHIRSDAREPVELRVGKHLDDIVDKKRVMTFPTQHRTDDESFSATPYYAVDDNLSIRCVGKA